MPDPETKKRGAPDGGADRCLDSGQLQRLEQAFREWASAGKRPDRCWSRRRILLIFLLIRHTGAKLNEVLALDPAHDLDQARNLLYLGRASDRKRPPREVAIASALADEIRTLLADDDCRGPLTRLRIDPAFVRRKFYERAEACGFPRQLGTPEMIRRARGAELLRHNLPLPAVQMLLGHATPNLTTAYVSFSAEELRQATRFFLERDPTRRTSARNRFFGKIRAIQTDELLASVELVTLGGEVITTVITNSSRERLGLMEGKMISAEVKAPSVLLQKQEEEPRVAVENILRGVIVRITRSAIMTEYVIRTADGSQLCAVVGSEGARRCEPREGEAVWALFSSFSVVLQAD